MTTQTPASTPVTSTTPSLLPTATTPAFAHTLASQVEATPIDTNSDRRKHRRFSVTRPGKIFRRTTQKFAAAESRDISFSGTLLDVLTDRPLVIGEIIDVALPFTKNSVVPEAALVQGIVVRASQSDMGRQRVAVRYIPTGQITQPLAQAA